MPDKFQFLASGLDSPAREAFAIGTASYGTAELGTIPRALYVGTGGNIAVTMANGAAVTFSNVQDGSILPIRVQKIGTATTASGIVGIL